MDKRNLLMRVLVGAWALNLLILLFKVGLAITGNYAVNWSQEAAFYTILVLTGGGAVTALSSRSAVRGRGGSTDTPNDTERTGA